MVRMVTGRYDAYSRKILIDEALSIPDGGRCLIFSDHPYLRAQVKLIEILKEDHKGDLTAAMDDYLAKHAERLIDFWKTHPDQREDVLESYFLDLEHQRTYHQV